MAIIRVGVSTNHFH